MRHCAACLAVLVAASAAATSSDTAIMPPPNDTPAETASTRPQTPPFNLASRFTANIPPSLRQRAAKLMTSPPPIAGSLASGLGMGLRASPAQLGGDPTGKVDSTVAVQAALAFCVNRSRHTAGIFPVDARDAGGCTVDLEGGEYLISTTLRIPAYTSNMQIGRGSPVATQRLPYAYGKRGAAAAAAAAAAGAAGAPAAATDLSNRLQVQMWYNVADIGKFNGCAARYLNMPPSEQAQLQSNLADAASFQRTVLNYTNENSERLAFVKT